MKRGFFSLFFVLVGTALNAQIIAVTEYGHEVLLYDDGTWSYIEVDEDGLQAVEMPTPAFQGQSGGSAQASSCKLVLKSSTANEITDDEAWLERNQLETGTYDVPNPFMGTQGNLPGDVPTYYNELMLVRAIRNEDYIYLIYGNDFSEGRYLLVMDQTSREIVQAFDFVNYEFAPEIVAGAEPYVRQRIDWATIEGTTLYVSHSHSTYAASSKGMNAYITAINLETTEVLWRSKPLTCNSTNFVIVDEAIICGYGFTDEKDFMYVLNRHDGKVYQTLPVKSGPSWIIRKKDELFVRTYNTDYIFTITH